MRITLLSALLISAAATAQVPDSFGSLDISSGPSRVSLIELYTSEGCSSCPPADRWLSGLKNNPQLWTEFAPIALHVDYWDYIGWKDRFATSEFSQRQQRYIDERGARTVYTPGVFENGNEWLEWRRGQIPSSQQEHVGELKISTDGTTLTARFDPSGTKREQQHRAYEVFVAILGMQIETRVQAGENNGRTLQHDFVVLDLQQKRMNKRGSSYQALVDMPMKSELAENFALVAWVSDEGRLMPIQTVGGFIDGQD